MKNKNFLEELEQLLIVKEEKKEKEEILEKEAELTARILSEELKLLTLTIIISKDPLFPKLTERIIEKIRIKIKEETPQEEIKLPIEVSTPSMQTMPKFLSDLARQGACGVPKC